jgi:hypothetical protein
MRLRHPETSAPFLFSRNFFAALAVADEKNSLKQAARRHVENSGLETYTPAMALLVDFLHLVVIVAGVGIGAWALIALRSRLPRGRFIVFSAASAGALFGCAALAGEVGFLPPVAWFAVVMAFMAAVAAVGYRTRPAPATWR